MNKIKIALMMVGLALVGCAESSPCELADSYGDTLSPESLAHCEMERATYHEIGCGEEYDTQLVCFRTDDRPDPSRCLEYQPAIDLCVATAYGCEMEWRALNAGQPNDYEACIACGRDGACD